MCKEKYIGIQGRSNKGTYKNFFFSSYIEATNDFKLSYF